MKCTANFIGIFFMLFVTQLHAEQTRYVGYAYTQQGNELLYTETHNQIRQLGRLIRDDVSYHDAQGVLFASKQVDYTQNPVAPDFRLNNHRTGHFEMGELSGSYYRVEFSPDSAAKTESRTLEFPDTGIADAGFDQFIETHWQELVSGRSLTRKFLIPSLFGFYDFRIYQAEVIDHPDEKIRVIHVEPANFFYRLLGGTTRLEYDHELPQLRRFTGISNMRDENGDNLMVNIVFPLEEQRVVSSEK